MRRGYLYEGQWTALGVFIGGFSQSSQSIYNAYFIDQTKPISIFDLGVILICVLSFGAFFLLKFVINKNQEKADILCERIRNRTRTTVQGGGVDEG